MNRIPFGIIIAFVFVISSTAQTRQSVPKKPVQPADRTVELSNLSRDANNLETSAGSNLSCGGVSTLTGRIIKREFDDNDVRLIGFVIREASDVRTFVNIDADHIAESDGLLPRQLSLILGKNKKVTIWAIRCENGNSASVPRSLFLNKVKAL